MVVVESIIPLVWYSTTADYSATLVLSVLAVPLAIIVGRVGDQCLVQDEACLAKLSRRRVQHVDLLLHVVVGLSRSSIWVLVFILVLLLLLEQVRLMILVIDDLLLG